MIKMLSANAVARTLGPGNIARAAFDGPGVQKNEKDRSEEKNPGQWERCVKHRDKEREGEKHPDSGNQEVGAAETFLEPVRHKSSQKRREKSRHHGDAAENRSGQLAGD